MNKQTILAVILAALFLAVAAGAVVKFFSGQSQVLNKFQPPAQKETQTKNQPAQKIAGTFTILMKAGRFEPNTIRVIAGKKYKLIVKNVDTFPHALVLMDLGIDTGRIEPGKEEEHEFEAPIVMEQKIYEFYSSVPGQRSITGSLIVDKNPEIKEPPRL